MSLVLTLRKLWWDWMALDQVEQHSEFKVNLGNYNETLSQKEDEQNSPQKSSKHFKKWNNLGIIWGNEKNINWGVRNKTTLKKVDFFETFLIWHRLPKNSLCTGEFCSGCWDYWLCHQDGFWFKLQNGAMTLIIAKQSFYQLNYIPTPYNVYL